MRRNRPIKCLALACLAWAWTSLVSAEEPATKPDAASGSGRIAASEARPAAPAKPAAPAAGRYRCYQPPTYSVTAWFDLEADGRYRLNGGPWERYSYHAANSMIRWSGGDFAAARLVGIYLPPGRPGADEDRVTIVLARGPHARPGKAGWDRLERCYLTMH